MTAIQVEIIAVDDINPMIRQLTLSPRNEQPLECFSPGAHIRVQVSLADDTTDWRQYSLIDFKNTADDATHPSHYIVAVLREDQGRGGSRFMHALRLGDILNIEPPKNNFPLIPSSDRKILIAGGIGVTPLISMAVQCQAQRYISPFKMIYAGRTRELMAYLPELHQLVGTALHVHVDDEAGVRLSMHELLHDTSEKDHFYICGPQAMLDAFLVAAEKRGWCREKIHFELFTAPPMQQGDHAFELVLAKSGKTITVSSDQTILDRLIEEGCAPLFDCKRGECGICAVPVLDGAIDHRDYVLSAKEKAAGKVIHVCTSRARDKRLVLDL